MSLHKLIVLVSNLLKPVWYFFWILYKGLDISIKDFASKTDLSELTINKISREISDILEIPILF